MPKRAAYATDYQPDWGFPWVPKRSREEWDRILAGLSEEEAKKKLLDYEQAYNYAEQQALLNPVGGGFTLESWREVMRLWLEYQVHVILGGNRSSKTTLATRMAVWVACTIPEAKVRGYHVNGDRSIEQQQQIWDAIPQSIKNLPTKKGQNHSITFSQKNGFTDGKCIFPPIAGARKGSEISFHNYSQYQQDAQVAEGFSCHFIFADEEIPQKLYETLLYRLIDYRGRMFLTFTTLHGWTPLIQDLLGKTQTLKKRYAPLVKKELPVLQKSLSRSDTCIHYFWTSDNPFVPADDMLERLKTRPKEEILARAYGIPTKSIANVFPKFDPEVNVIKRADLPWIKDPKYEVTRYVSIDPAGKKNWYILWVAVDALGSVYCFREFPDSSYGPWALPGATSEGKPGPGQKGSGLGIRGYVELVQIAEGWRRETPESELQFVEGESEDILDRVIDPRMGAAERQTLEGATTIISELDEAGMTVNAAPGVDIESGLQAINDLLEWDERQPRSVLNSPKLYVVEDLENLIYSLKEYTGEGGSNEACKDPIDALRYILVAGCHFVSPEKMKDIGGRTGCY